MYIFRSHAKGYDGTEYLGRGGWTRSARRGAACTEEDGKDRIAGPWNLTVPLLMRQRRQSRDHTSGSDVTTTGDRRQETGQQRAKVQRLRIRPTRLQESN